MGIVVIMSYKMNVDRGNSPSDSSLNSGH